MLGLIDALVEEVDRVVIVDDGAPQPVADELARLAEISARIEIVALGVNRGKGHAVARGIGHALARDSGAEAVLVVDADGQHPVDATPAFVAAAEHAELVVGDRMGNAAAMPAHRRVANRVASALVSVSTARRVRDSQCGMRLLRGRALHEIVFPGGGYEAETVHLRRCLRAGVAIAWVPIPAIYDGQRSSFRWLGDSLRVALAACGAGAPARPQREAARLPPALLEDPALAE